MMFRIAARISLLATTLTLLAVSTAFASTTFYASPGGVASTASGCLAIAPCGINTALNYPSFADGDEVVLQPGDYTLASTIMMNKSIYVHGTGKASDTRITSAASFPFLLQVQGARLSQIQLIHTDTNGMGVSVAFGTLSNSIIDSQSSIGCSIRTGKIVDTICIAHGSGDANTHGAGIASTFSGDATFVLRNVTAIGKGASYSSGLFVSSDPGITLSGDVKSSIFVGAGGAGSEDVYGTNSSGTAAVTLDHSNFSTPASAGVVSFTGNGVSGNQSGEVTFVDPANNDYHLSKNSLHAINLGAVDGQSGTKDIDNEDRPQGSAAEIGADELDGVAPAPPVITGPASGTVTAMPFTVTGSAEPGSEVYVGDGFDPVCQGATNSEGVFSCSAAGTLADGPHNLRANAADDSGNLSGISADVPIIIDTVAPVVAVTSPVNGSTLRQIPTLAFTANDLNKGSGRCRIDNNDFNACVSGASLGALADGPHTVTVRYSDLAGNVGTASSSFVIDSTAPKLQKVSVRTRKGRTTVKFRADEPAAFTCKLDKGKARSCGSPYKTGKAKSGRHRLTVIGTDAVGNVGAPLTFSWKVKK